jgi:hypothetical protein
MRGFFASCNPEFDNLIEEEQRTGDRTLYVPRIVI